MTARARPEPCGARRIRSSPLSCTGLPGGSAPDQRCPAGTGRPETMRRRERGQQRSTSGRSIGDQRCPHRERREAGRREAPRLAPSRADPAADPASGPRQSWSFGNWSADASCARPWPRRSPFRDRVPDTRSKPRPAKARWCGAGPASGRSRRFSDGRRDPPVPPGSRARRLSVPAPARRGRRSRRGSRAGCSEPRRRPAPDPRRSRRDNRGGCSRPPALRAQGAPRNLRESRVACSRPQPERPPGAERTREPRGAQRRRGAPTSRFVASCQDFLVPLTDGLSENAGSVPRLLRRPGACP